MLTEQLFDDDLAEIDVWGYPWHGLASRRFSGTSNNATLPLPNGTGKSINSPNKPFVAGNPAPSPDSYGATFYLKVPGTELPERNTEQQALDDDAGIEWRNAAILSGGRLQLYNKPLDGWIYVSPDGRRWLVRCPEIINTQTEYSTWNFTISLFGDFTAAAESYTFTVTPPYGAGNVCTLSSTKSDGSKAIVTVGAIHTGDIGRHFNLPIGYEEITITGTGPTLNVGVATVRNLAQTLVRDYGDPGRTIADPGGYLISNGSADFNNASIVGLWYTPDDALVECILRTSGTYTEVNPDWSAGDPQTNSVTMSGNITLEVGGVIKHSLPISASIVYYQEKSLADCTKTASYSIHTYTVTDNQFENHQVGGYATASIFDVISDHSVFIDSPFLAAGDQGNTEPAEIATNEAEARIAVRYFSRQVIGYTIRAKDRTVLVGNAMSPGVGPTGPAAGAMVSISQSASYYGSYNPYTGQVSAQFEWPVCWV
jgi:hypothetical protein